LGSTNEKGKKELGLYYKTFVKVLGNDIDIKTQALINIARYRALIKN
jgi:hypothetical protein